MAAHRAVQKGWAPHAGATAGGRLLWLVHGLSRAGTQQPAGAGYPGEWAPAFRPSRAGNLLHGPRSVPKVLLSMDSLGVRFHFMRHSHGRERPSDRPEPVATPGSMGALQPLAHRASAHGQLLKRREGGVALFTDRKAEAQTGAHSLRPRTLLGQARSPGRPGSCPASGCSSVPWTRVGGRGWAGLCGAVTAGRGERAGARGAQCFWDLHAQPLAGRGGWKDKQAPESPPKAQLGGEAGWETRGKRSRGASVRRKIRVGGGERGEPSTLPGAPLELAGPDQVQGRGDGALGLEKAARADLIDGAGTMRWSTQGGIGVRRT